MIVFEKTGYSQVRQDLMNRIAQKHQQWIKDCGQLYEMGGLWPAQLEHDLFLLLMAELAMMIAKHEVPLTKVSRELKNFLAQLKAQSDDRSPN